MDTPRPDRPDMDGIDRLVLEETALEGSLTGVVETLRRHEVSLPDRIQSHDGAAAFAAYAASDSIQLATLADNIRMIAHARIDAFSVQPEDPPEFFAVGVRCVMVYADRALRALGAGEDERAAWLGAQFELLGRPSDVAWLSDEPSGHELLAAIPVLEAAQDMEDEREERYTRATHEAHELSKAHEPRLSRLEVHMLVMSLDAGRVPREELVADLRARVGRSRAVAILGIIERNLGINRGDETSDS